MSNVNINSTAVDSLLNQLGDKEQANRILFNAVKDGARVLQQTTKNFFKRAMGESANHISRHTNKPFADGVTLKSDKSYIEATVSIMGDHRMKWFELGTRNRYTKGRKIVGYAKGRKLRLEREGKGHFTGSIVGKYFFRAARQSGNGAVNDAIKQSINNALSKLGK